MGGHINVGLFPCQYFNTTINYRLVPNAKKMLLAIKQFTLHFPMHKIIINFAVIPNLIIIIPHNPTPSWYLKTQRYPWLKTLNCCCGGYFRLWTRVPILLVDKNKALKSNHQKTVTQLNTQHGKQHHFDESKKLIFLVDKSRG